MIEAGAGIPAAAAAGVLLAGLLGWGVLRYLRNLVWRRCVRLEETLQVYRNANAGVGRHVTVLEAELRELRERLAAIEGGRNGAEAARVTPAPELRVKPDVDAEERLSRLIRSRLRDTRAVV